MPAASPPVVSEDEIVRAVGPAAFARAQAYAALGRVQDVHWDPEHAEVFSVVSGSAAEAYGVTVQLDVRGPEPRIRQGWCDCPVGKDCKHVAATLLVAGDRTGGGVDDPAPSPASPESAGSSPTSAWRKAFAPLIAGASSPAAAEHTAVGLLVTVQPPLQYRWYGETSHRLAARPVVVGRKGRWIHTGIEWTSLAYQRAADPAHLGVLRSLLALYNAETSTGYAPQWLELSAISSPLLWDLLERARAVGLPIVVDGADQAPVTIHDDPVRIEVDISRRPDGDLLVGARLNPLPDGDERTGLIGQPPHGVFRWRSGPGDRPISITLAPTRAEDLPASAQLVGTAGVVVPAAEASEFATRVLPPLLVAEQVVSSDGSFDVPELPRPVLVVTVEHSPGPTLDVDLGWGYRVGGDSPAGPVRRLWSTGTGEFRDRSAEDRVLAGLSWVLDASPLLAEPHATGPRLAASTVLSGDAVISFVRDVLPRLRAEGDVQVVDVTPAGAVPAYVEAVGEPEIHIRTEPRPDSTDWFDLDVEVSIDGQEIVFGELFRAIAADQEYLVLPSGTYFSLDRSALRALRSLIEESRALGDRGRDSLRVSRYHVDLWRELVELGVVDSQAQHWREAVDALAGEPVLLPTPDSIHATLRDYQQKGFSWLVFLRERGLGGILADDMGLGKTLQALASIAHGRRAGDPPFLVVAPTSVLSNWAAEAHRFAPTLRTVVVDQTTAKRGSPLADRVAGADIVITSYTLLRLDAEHVESLPWAGLFLDEAQFVKNHNSLAHQCARRLQADVKVAVTGTPLENNLMELWSLLSITAPGLFPSPKRFAEFYQRPIERDGDSDRLALLRRRISPFLLRRTKEEVASDLPPKQEHVVEVDLAPRHRKVYDTHLQRERQKVLGLLADLDTNRFEIFRSLTMLRQLALDASLVSDEYVHVPSTKLELVVERLADISAEGHRALVFSQFTSYLALARKRLDAAGIAYAYLDGSTRRRPEVIESFRAGEAPVFLISLKAGGFGLNLTEADYVMLLDPWWNPAAENQAVDRAHRIGQTRPVIVQRFVARDTIEEKVMALKASKSALFDAVVAGTSTTAAGLTAAEIRELLA